MNITGMSYDTDEARLRALETLIAQGEEYERREAARKAEEERLRAAREATPGHTLDDLRRIRDELLAQKAAREHHLQVEAERDVLQRRAERLAADIEAERTKLADLVTEHATLAARMG